MVVLLNWVIIGIQIVCVGSCNRRNTCVAAIGNPITIRVSVDHGEGFSTAEKIVIIFINKVIETSIVGTATVGIQFKGRQ